MVKKFFSILFLALFIFEVIPFVLFANFFYTVEEKSFFGEEFSPLVHEFVIDLVAENFPLKDFPAMAQDDFKALFSGVFVVDDVSFLLSDFADSVRSATLDVNGSLIVKLPSAWIARKTALVVEKMAPEMYAGLDQCSASLLITGDSFLPEANCLDKRLVSEEDFLSILSSATDREVVSKFPNEIVLPSFIRGFFDGSYWNFFSIILYVWAVGLFLFLFLIVLLLWLDWRSIVRYLSLAFLVPSTALFVLMVLLKNSLFLADFAKQIFVGDLSARASRFLIDVFSYFIERFSSPISNYLLYVLIFSLLLFVVSFKIPAKISDLPDSV